MGSGKQYTYLETDTVRYVYQPIETLFLVLITNRSSNIVEDLETLRLLGRIVPDYCPKLEEDDISKKAFELLFAFDEVISLGYRDSMTLEQVKTCLEMDSNEERIAKAAEDARIKEANAAANAKAKQFSKEKRANKSGGISSLDPSSLLSSITDDKPSSTPVVVPDERLQSTIKSSSSKGGMALGKKGGKEDLVSKMVKAGELEVAVSPPPAAKVSHVPNRPAARMDNVHLKSEERISAVLNRDGGFQTVEVKGDMFLTVSDSSCASIRVCLNREQNNSYAWKTHPNINKTPWTKDRVLSLKDPSKPFPVGTALGIVRWRLQNTADFVPPISVNCWPGDSAVTIEYECERSEVVLTNVQISIPMGGATPEVGDMDCGVHSYDPRSQVLTWTIDKVDKDNLQGSMEVNLDSNVDAAAFFPVDIQFFAETCLASVVVTDVLSNDTGLSVPYSTEVLVAVDSYQVV
eukprot:GGOE01062011.1.p1 GENE.GGOE01062011.1~~GGOE01062011.1.p1  ORF type:complete len:510 (+),score=103.66 GGOE01062011.1:142-1530(+)